MAATRRMVVLSFCVAGSVAATAVVSCAPYLPAPPDGRGYTYVRVGVPYRAERRGDTLGGAYRRAFATTPDGPAVSDPGPLVGGTPTGFVYNAHLGDAGERLEPPALPPPAETTAADAGLPAVPDVGSDADGGAAADAGGAP